MDYLDLELNLTEDDLAVKRAAQKFAEKIVRPIAGELDTMTADLTPYTLDLEPSSPEKRKIDFVAEEI